MYHRQPNEADAAALISPATARRLLSLCDPDLRAYLALCEVAGEAGASADEIARVSGVSANRTARYLGSLARQGLAIKVRCEGRGRPVLYTPGDSSSLFSGDSLPGVQRPEDAHSLPGAVRRAKSDGQTAPGSRAADCMESGAPASAHASPNPVAPESLDSLSLSLSARSRDEKSVADTAASGADAPKGPDAVPEIRGSRMADHVLHRLKEIRLRVAGRSRLTLPEVRGIRGLLASGATLADFEEAVEDWEARRKAGKAPDLNGLAYLIPVAEEIAAGRREFAEPTTESTDARTNGRGNPKGAGVLGRAPGPAGGDGQSNGRPTHTFTSAEENERLARLNAELAERYFPARPAGRPAGEAV